MTIQANFSQIEDWLTQHAAPLSRAFQTAATLENIQHTEAALQVTFPKSVREAYLAHNGEVKASYGLFGCYRWLSLAEVITLHNEMKGIEEIHQFGDFTPSFMLPLLISGGGDFYYVESVSSADEESEVIDWWHEVPTRDVKFPSFSNMLETFVNDLQAGQYLYRPKFKGLIHQGNY
ncbi:MAG: SMI1/KNR4 family protein [Cyanobacteria bacterium J06555_13]